MKVDSQYLRAMRYHPNTKEENALLSTTAKPQSN